MAQTLPTFTVSDAVATRLMTAFGSAAQYKTWLADAIKSEAIRRETQAIDDTSAQQKSNNAQSLRSMLDPDLPT